MKDDEGERLGERLFADFAAAMMASDKRALRSMLADSFTLTHITGYLQPAEEWLREIDEGQFIYHGISVKDRRVRITSDSAEVIARTLTDAKVYGSRHVWPLQLTVHFSKKGDGWQADRAFATLWH